MRGIIIAGGNGTRLHPITKVCNKSLLPVYDRPMIYYPINSLVKSGITDILIVCNSPDIMRVLGSGEKLGANFSYVYQEEALGIAHALKMAVHWLKDEPVCVVLADNIIDYNFSKSIKEFTDGAAIFIRQTTSPPYEYGVVETDKFGTILSIEEKPKVPKSNLISIGLYLYDAEVKKNLDLLLMSNRGEFEITDLNNIYLKQNKLKALLLGGEWFDAGGSFDSYLDVCNQMRGCL